LFSKSAPDFASASPEVNRWVKAHHLVAVTGAAQAEFGYDGDG
jgi:hypothetical protein